MCYLCFPNSACCVGCLGRFLVVFVRRLLFSFWAFCVESVFRNSA